MAGTVGAIFNSALQFGSAIGLAAMSSIQSSVEATHGGPHEYAGRAATFWFLTGIVALPFVSMLIFYNRSTDHGPQAEHVEPTYPAQLGTDSEETLDNANIIVTVLATPKLPALDLGIKFCS